MRSFNKATFFIVAHMDDWQLFMNPIVARELSYPENKVVLIHTTGNDAGYDLVHCFGKEAATISSIHFGISHLRNTNGFRNTIQINNHILHRWVGINIICYFLRLPDGNMNGNGFFNQGYQSLHKLYHKEINSIRTVDHTNIYHGWLDFVQTLQKIIDYEVDGAFPTSIHYPETDHTINPDDHSDHRITGLAVQALPKLNQYHCFAYIGYHLRNYPEDLSGIDLFWKIGQFVVYDRAFYTLSNYSIIKESQSNYINFCLRAAKFRKLA